MAFETTIPYTTPICEKCGETTLLSLTAQEATDLDSGTYLQDALYLRSQDFHVLFLTGTHEHCLDA